MMEYIAGATIVGLIVLLWFEKQESKSTINKLTNALVAKSAKELRDLELSDKVEPVKKEPEPRQDLIEIRDLDEKEFLEKVILQEEREVN